MASFSILLSASMTAKNSPVALSIAAFTALDFPPFCLLIKIILNPLFFLIIS